MTEPMTSEEALARIRIRYADVPDVMFVVGLFDQSSTVLGDMVSTVLQILDGIRAAVIDAGAAIAENRLGKATALLSGVADILATVPLVPEDAPASPPIDEVYVSQEVEKEFKDEGPLLRERIAEFAVRMMGEHARS